MADNSAKEASKDAPNIQLRGQHGKLLKLLSSNTILFSDTVRLSYGLLQINTKPAQFCRQITAKENLKYLAHTDRPVMGLTARYFDQIQPAAHDLQAIDNTDLTAPNTAHVQLHHGKVKAKAIRTHLRLQSFSHMVYNHSPPISGNTPLPLPLSHSQYQSTFDTLPTLH
jgi:hypothetical protein